MGKNIAKDLEPYSPSLQDFCRFLENRGQQAVSPKSIAELWESQAEALRISHEDAGVEAIDMLLDTMLTTLRRLAEAQEQQRWPNRIKTLFKHSRFSLSCLSRPVRGIPIHGNDMGCSSV